MLAGLGVELVTRKRCPRNPKKILDVRDDSGKRRRQGPAEDFVYIPGTGIPEVKAGCHE
jgi:hypothetical protein